MSQHAEETVRLYQRALKVSDAAGADHAMIEKIRSGLRDARSTTTTSRTCARIAKKPRR